MSNHNFWDLEKQSANLSAKESKGFDNRKESPINNVSESDDYWSSNQSQGFSFDELPSNDLHGVSGVSTRFRPTSFTERPTATVYSSEPSLDIDQLKKSKYTNVQGVEESCAVCHKKIVECNFRCEGSFMYCSEKCWQDCIREAVSAWNTGIPTQYSLQSFKSYESKAFILNQAVMLKNADLVLKVILHVKHVLSKYWFKSLLFDNSVAMTHYITFLKQTGQTKKAAELLSRQGFIAEAKMTNHRALMTDVIGSVQRNYVNCIRRLKEFAMEELSVDPILSDQYQMVVQHAELLKEQVSLEEKYKLAATAPLSPDVNELLPASFINLSLCDTIHSLVLIHGSCGPSSPAYQLKTRFKMSDNHYRWTIVEPVSYLSRWQELDTVMFNQKWLSRKVETFIPTERLVLLLNSLNAPYEVLHKYVALIPDQENLMRLALQLKLYSVALKTCVKQRDIAALKQLAKEVPQDRQEWHLIQNYLHTPPNKWKE